MALGPSPLPKGDQLMIATWPILTTLWPNGAPVCDAKRRSLQPLSEHSLFLSSSSVNYSAAFFFLLLSSQEKGRGVTTKAKALKGLSPVPFPFDGRKRRPSPLPPPYTPDHMPAAIPGSMMPFLAGEEGGFWQCRQALSFKNGPSGCSGPKEMRRARGRFLGLV